MVFQCYNSLLSITDILTYRATTRGPIGPKNEFLNQTYATLIDDLAGSIHDSDPIPSQDEGHACTLSEDVQFV